MDKVAEFYALWFVKKRAAEYSAAEAGSAGLDNDLLGVYESNKRDFWQSCAVRFLRGTILHLSSQAHLQGEKRMTLWEVIAFLEAQPIEKSWKQLIMSHAGDEGIRRIAAEAGEFMLNSPPPVAKAILGLVAPIRRGARPATKVRIVMNIIRKLVFYVLNSREKRAILNRWKSEGRIPQSILLTH